MSQAELEKVEAKKNLRKKFQILRDAFASSEHDHQVCHHLLGLLESESGLWGAYKSLAKEVDISSCIESLNLVKWAYPRVAGELLKFYVPQDSNSYQKSSLGISEPFPEKSNLVSLTQMSGILVPGVAFDRRGFRLGRGKAFYDKVLKNWNGKKIGIAYSVQVSEEELPVSAHDVQMDMIVTDVEVLRISA